MADQKIPTYFYAIVGLGVLGFVLALAGGVFSLIGGIFTGLSAALGVLLLKYGYIVIPFVTQKTKAITVSDLGGYEIPPSQDVIVKNMGDAYYASAYLSIEVFKSPTEEPREEILKYNEFFERAISSLRHVTKIGYLIQIEDISRKKRELEEKRSEAQQALSKERQKPIDKEGKQRLVLERFEREFEIWDKQLAKISKGRKPMGVLAYAMATAAGVSKESAISNVRSYAEEIKIAIANSLNVDVKVLSGDDLLRCFECEKFYPITVQEIESESMSNI